MKAILLCRDKVQTFGQGLHHKSYFLGKKFGKHVIAVLILYVQLANN